MKKVQAQALSFAFLLALIAAPGTAFAFLTVDTLPWPSRGAFPAYPPDEVRPTTIWAQGGVMRDDNLLRLENNGPGDTVGRMGAGLRYEQRIIGRQRVVVDARGDYYAFHRFSELDHFAYSLNGTWNWEIGNNLAGTVTAGRDRRLVDLSETQVPVRDLITESRLGATAGVLITPSFRVRGGVAAARGDSSARAESDTRGLAWVAGAEYVSPLRNTVGVEYRRADGDAPVPEPIAPIGTFVNNDFIEEEVALVVAYAFGEQLRSEWRIGRTARDYSQLQGRNFSGTTYRARVEWLPGTKTILGLEVYREPRSIIDVAASHVLVQGVGFGPSWAATNKLLFSLRLLREQRRFGGDPFLVGFGGPQRDEIVYIARFGIGWEPVRHWEVSFGLDFGERESNFAGRDYKFTAGMANVAWRF